MTKLEAVTAATATLQSALWSNWVMIANASPAWEYSTAGGRRLMLDREGGLYAGPEMKMQIMNCVGPAGPPFLGSFSQGRGLTGHQLAASGRADSFASLPAGPC